MKLAEFDYHLPPELIAQEPATVRDQSRMMVVRKADSSLHHRHFFNLPEYLGKGDVLVLNDSKVIPARLFGKKETGAVIEALLLTQTAESTADRPVWEVLLRPGKRVNIGIVLAFDGGGQGRIVARISDKKWLVEFKIDLPFHDFLDRYGSPPLPPYINRKQNAKRVHDRERYQTVYALQPGSVAAPTAGLHFTPEILKEIETLGVSITRVTLHVGYGTFVPMEVKNVKDHTMEAEYFEISPESASVISGAQRVIAVGTTSTRVLESVTDERGRITATSGYTRLFIYPGYRFKRVNALLTNFHLPKSSLFLLTSAFGGTDLIRKAYAEAIHERYRFYSYGDCMLIS